MKINPAPHGPGRGQSGFGASDGRTQSWQKITMIAGRSDYVCSSLQIASVIERHDFLGKHLDRSISIPRVSATVTEIRPDRRKVLRSRSRPEALPAALHLLASTRNVCSWVVAMSRQSRNNARVSVRRPLPRAANPTRSR